MIFSTGTTTIRATDLTIEQAEEIESQYPGLYVQVIEEKPVEKPVSKPKAE